MGACVSSDDDRTIDADRRRLLMTAGGVVGAAAAASVVVPFVASMNPSERALAAGAPVEIDVSQLKPGQMVTATWRGRPVWVLARTPEMLASLAKHAPELADPHSEHSTQPDYCRNETRSIRPGTMVALGVCTHLGCAPTAHFKTGIESGLGPDWSGGFFCPCHGSTFDLAGRVFKDKLAPLNLEVPPHRFLEDGRLVIGEDAGRA